MKQILISGCQGFMGRVVEKCIGERTDCTVCGGVDILPADDRAFPVYTDWNKIEKIPDVIIDFSSPKALTSLLGYAVAHNVPVVLATTGYTEEQKEEIRLASQKIPVFFSFNMSMGINLLASLAKKAAAFLGDDFDVEIVEMHHNRKVDAPSGTAIMLADAINEEKGGNEIFVYDRHAVRKKRDKREIGIHSVRGGTIVGEHEVIFAGRDEVITLSHSAASREVFAVGAVKAAIFLSSGQAPGMYDMSALL